MPRRSRVGVAVLGLLLVTGFARGALAQLVVSFRSPHTARVPSATLSSELAKRVDETLGQAPPKSPEELLTFALRTTGAELHFGLGHRTSLRFEGREREGNCIEYAELFATLYNRAAVRTAVTARAYSVHSGDARVFGQTLPVRGFGDHDWVLIVIRKGSESTQLFVDPTLYDAGLGWDISRSVEGKVTPP